MHIAMRNISAAQSKKQFHPKRKIKLITLDFLVLVSLACSTATASAQTLFGSIVGTITDSSGASVVGATVTAVSIQTNDTRTVKTSSTGVFTMATMSVGVYKVTVTKTGFQSFTNPSVEITANSVSRFDAHLEIGNVTETIEVHTGTAQLQTDTAEVRTEINATTLRDVPQPTRTYQGVFNLVPGIAPPSGAGFNQGTNNPSRSLSFSANGTGTTGPNIRIEGVNATNQWLQQFTTFVPSTEAIESVNVVTNSPNAEQGLSGGPAVTVTLKSGSNAFHGSAYAFNISSFGMTRDFFQPAGQKPPHFVDNNVGVTISGPIIRNKLFYFGSYEGDFTRQAYSGLVSVPTPTMLSGDMFSAGDNTNGVVTAANQLYDPFSGDANGAHKTPFPGNVIPASRINPIIRNHILPFLGTDSVNNPNAGAPGAIQNNLFVKQANMYNLHKIDSKFDYIATSKLRVSFRYSKQPYNSLLNPIFGTPLGGTSNNWPAFAKAGNGNYYEHGAVTALSSSATYVFTPTLVADFTFGETSAHQYLIPQFADQKYGLDVLGIPGTNQGAQEFLTGGFPNLSIANYGGSTGAGTFGYSYPPMEYNDPVFEYVGNITKTHGSHSIRAGFDIVNLHMNHDEIRQTIFYFSGAGTTQAATGSAPGQVPNAYNAVADFLLGAVNYRSTWVMFDDTLRMYARDYALYVRDQWQMNPKLTINYGVRWEYYPVPNRGKRGIEYNNTLTDPTNNTLRLCGVGTQHCGISVSPKLFAPSIGIAYRPSEKVVVRTGFSLSPQQNEMGQALTQNFPAEQQYSSTGANSYSITSNLSDGLPILTAPTFSSDGTVVIPRGTSNATTTDLKFRRGYVESWNLTVEKEFGGDLIASLGYVGTHVVNQLGNYNFNHGTLGGGAASQPLNTPALGITGTANVFRPIGSERYNSLQASLNKRLSHGLTTKLAYTWSRDISNSWANGILIQDPQYYGRNKGVASSDRTHNISITATYQSPFGKNKTWLTQGFGGMVLGDWALSPTFTHLSGTPYSIAGSSASCNCPGNTQRADQVGPITKVGRGVLGQPYFNPLAFANVTTVRFGNAAPNSLRGPGYTNLDASLTRSFHVWERINLVIKADAFNVMNHAHFANPGTALSNLKLNSDGSVNSLNGYDTITSTAPLGRTLDQRYFRFGGRITW
ncbi:carboxypeptidase regulatory-like domain-containing protein [Edaphobacter sp. 12200R-103]|uniref:TonB-dependent receptor n=1 Tax=Edaphobacter sp. 12200R-103 TaxID=2703788 RepID=UPI00138C8598|nr:carboxypeptidase regulatory-like domain-containing protein [Edaphobacter sp. 12200R-103]QHS53158.1 TonB-dependent receptor [Edaphobacter sp. 12200R-103]